jgi:hypothetical protein
VDVVDVLVTWHVFGHEIEENAVVEGDAESEENVSIRASKLTRLRATLLGGVSWPVFDLGSRAPQRR